MDRSLVGDVVILLLKPSTVLKGDRPPCPLLPGFSRPPAAHPPGSVFVTPVCLFICRTYHEFQAKNSGGFDFPDRVDVAKAASQGR